MSRIADFCRWAVDEESVLEDADRPKRVLSRLLVAPLALWFVGTIAFYALGQTYVGLAIIALAVITFAPAYGGLIVLKEEGAL